MVVNAITFTCVSCNALYSGSKERLGKFCALCHGVPHTPSCYIHKHTNKLCIRARAAGVSRSKKFIAFLPSGCRGLSVMRNFGFKDLQRVTQLNRETRNSVLEHNLIKLDTALIQQRATKFSSPLKFLLTFSKLRLSKINQQTYTPSYWLSCPRRAQIITKI
jgi:hypothetical protein